MYNSSFCLSPACHELLSFVSSVLQAVVAVGSAKTGSGQAEIFAGQAALAGEQAVSLVHVAAAVGPKTCQQKGNIKKHIMAKNEGKGESIENKRKTCNVDVNQRINIITERRDEDKKQSKKKGKGFSSSIFKM